MRDLFLVLITRLYNTIQALHPTLKWILKYFPADYRLYIPMQTLCRAHLGSHTHTGGSHRRRGTMVLQRWSQHPWGPEFVQGKLPGGGQRQVRSPRMGGICELWHVMKMRSNIKGFFQADAISCAVQHLQHLREPGGISMHCVSLMFSLEMPILPTALRRDGFPGHWTNRLPACGFELCCQNFSSWQRHPLLSLH